VTSLAAEDAAIRMDRMYRYQRHIYDLTRKFYLLGRDDLLRSLPRRPGLSICEIGSGTGRNLVKLARWSPECALYGVDVSNEMLASARASLKRAGADGRVKLAAVSADGFDPQAAFGVERFDVVFFSYVLSMVPDWRAALAQAQRILAPGGLMAIVDFGDQQAAPAWRRRLLLAWLRLFDVFPRAEIEAGLHSLAASCDPDFVHASVADGYAYRLMFRVP
jgi:S-adenosylmethionine-diacylgycerolhomoserine-N-methlytransferase